MFKESAFKHKFYFLAKQLQEAQYLFMCLSLYFFYI